MWPLLSALVLGLGVNTAAAQCPNEGCSKSSSCPKRTGIVIIGTGVNSDAGLIGSVILNERDFNCTQCPISASKLGICGKCPNCEGCSGCCEKCPECDGCCSEECYSGCAAGKCAEKHGTLTLGVGISLLPGLFPLPVPSLEVNVTSAPTPACAPPAPRQATAEVDEPDEKQFIIETRLMDMRSGQPEQVLFAPRVTVLEGQAATVSMCDGVAQAGHRGGPLPERMDGLLQVQVEQLDSGNLLLDLTVQKNTVEKSNKRGTVVLCRRLAALQEVKPGTPMKLVLEKDDQGEPRMWMEVLVKDASEVKEIIPPRTYATGSQAGERYGEDTMPPRTYGFGSPAGKRYGQEWSGPVEASPTAGKHYGEEWLPPDGIMPLPMPPVPVTVYVPQPVPPLHPAMIPAPAAMSGVPCPCPAGEAIPCNAATIVTMPAANMASVFRAIKEDGHARLEVLHGPFSRMTCPSMTWGVPGCKPLKFTAAGERVHVSGDQLSAYANRVVADAEDHLVMEGQVRLTYEPEYEGGAQGAPHHIKADKVTIHLHDGHLDVEMRTKSSN
jgi:hypothetical protein